jgi:hypothetical protein
MYEHVKTGCKHIPPSEQPLQFQSGYFFNTARILYMFVVCLRTEIHVSSNQCFLSHHNQNENQGTFSHGCFIFSHSVEIPHLKKFVALILGGVANLRKTTVSFVMSLSVRLEPLCSHERIFVKLMFRTSF